MGILRLLNASLDGSTVLLLRIAVALQDLKRMVNRRHRVWRGSLRRILRSFLPLVGLAKPTVFMRRRRIPWNRTPEDVEEQVVRLHIEQPHLGVGQLALLAERVLGFRAVRETMRRILLRRRDLVIELEQGIRQRRRHIRVTGRRQLWGADFTLVWLLGFLPICVFAVVDYQGSYLLAFERVSWPTSSETIRVLRRLFAEYGPPDRLLTDRAPCLRTADIEAFFDSHATRHVLIRPGHCWTNGRIERIFRTAKEAFSNAIWLFKSVRQIDRFCADFLLWHNRDRPHSAWEGRTPDEVFFDRPKQRRPLGRVSYFDGHLHWYRFGA